MAGLTINGLTKARAGFAALGIHPPLKKRRIERRNRPAPTGTKHTGAHVPPATVNAIADMRRNGYSIRAISRDTGLANNTVHAVITSNQMACGMETRRQSIAMLALEAVEELTMALMMRIEDMPVQHLGTAAKLMLEIHLLTTGRPTERHEVMHTIDHAALAESYRELELMAIEELKGEAGAIDVESAAAVQAA